MGLEDKHLPCLQAEGHTAHTDSAPLQSRDACSQSAATPVPTKTFTQNQRGKI